MNISINIFYIVIAATASMGVGFLWYSKMAFGTTWAKLKGYTDASLKKAQKDMGPLYGISFLAALVTAYVLAHVMALSDAFYQYGPLQTGVTSAFFMWLGFVLPVQLTGQIFGEKNWQLLAIDTGYQLTPLLVMAGVIGMLS